MSNKFNNFDGKNSRFYIQKMNNYFSFLVIMIFVIDIIYFWSVLLRRQGHQMSLPQVDNPIFFCLSFAVVNIRLNSILYLKKLKVNGEIKSVKISIG